jgi:hypothetical protein
MALNEVDPHRLGSLASLPAAAYAPTLTLLVQDAAGKLYRIAASALLSGGAVVDLPRSVLDRTRTTPPGAPGTGDTHIVAGTGGGWSGFAVNDVVRWTGSAWELVSAPVLGWTLWVAAETANVQWRGSGWTLLDDSGATASYWLLSNVGGGVAGDAFADPTSAAPIEWGFVVYDETTNLGGGIVTLKFAGAGVNAAKTGANEATITVGGGAAEAAFGNITIGATTIAATIPQDIIELIAGTGITITPDAPNKKVTIAGTSSGLAFKTIAVAGQSNIVADAADDTLTVVGSGGLTITTNAGTDTLTIDGAASSHSHSPVLTLSTPLLARATGQTVTAGSETTIDIDTEIYDPSSNYTLSSDGEVTLGASGTYLAVFLPNVSSATNNNHAPCTFKLQDNSGGSFADIANTTIQLHASALSMASLSGVTGALAHCGTYTAGQKIRLRLTPSSGWANATISSGSRLLVFRLVNATS